MNNLSVLVFSNLKGQSDWESVNLKELDEPMHPYLGVKWAFELKKYFNQLYFLNQVYLPNNKFLKFIIKYFVLPKKYDVIICHSTIGLGTVSLIKICNWNVKIVYYSLSKTNPNGNFLTILFRKVVQKLDYFFSSKIIVGLNSLKNEKFKRKLEYFPFYTDVNYFKSRIKLGQIGYDYILIVGDITRDDQFVYSSLKDLNIPIIRITRDEIIEKRVLKMYNRMRGDLVLKGITFEELIYYYSNSKLCITASSEDNWQPGGITSIVEAISCGSICLANSSGEIEKEFKWLSSEFKTSDPIYYFDYPDELKFKEKVEKILKFDEKQIKEKKIENLNFADLVLNINKNGIFKLKNIYDQI